MLRLMFTNILNFVRNLKQGKDLNQGKNKTIKNKKVLQIKLDDIKSPLKNDLQDFDRFFNGILKSDVKLLDTILRYVVRRKGKQIRPLLVLLSAAMNGGVSEKSFRGAALIELLHTATLVHDDVVDDSFERRGVFSINALWKNKTAVLIGDYLLSRGMLLALTNKDYDYLQITSEAVKIMSEGELLQIEKARTLDIKEDVYFDIIRMKTASLISAACGIGAASASAEEQSVESMKKFGEFLGIAFQIKDDLLDFATTVTGKPQGGDLKEKKLTLPLIFALRKAEKKERKEIINLIARQGKLKETYNRVRAFIQEKGGFDYAEQKMKEYANKAKEELDGYGDSDYKTSLLHFVDFNANRSK